MAYTATFVVDSNLLASWQREKARLEQSIVDAQRQLHALRQMIEGAERLVKVSQEPEKSENPAPGEVDTSNVMGTLARLANEAPRPMTKAELKEAAVKAGVPAERVKGAYFYVALNRMK